ncbi:MAG: ferritin family protein [Smithella sp.]
MRVFEASDIVGFAVRIEENGANFYKYAEQIAGQEEVKQLFTQLAADELAHKKVFEAIFAEIEKFSLPESYEGEYCSYLRDYVDNNIIFTKEKMDKELSHVKDTLSALDFAIKRELDSVFYYNEIKRFVVPAQHSILDQIINEERKHFTRLSEAKQRYSACKED